MALASELAMEEGPPPKSAFEAENRGVPPGFQAPPDTAERERPAIASSELLRRYSEGKNERDRSTVIAEIAMLEAADALPALMRIFTLEKEAGLRTEMMELLPDIEGKPADKLILINLALSTNSPLELRVAAADALENIDTPGTELIWQRFLGDPAMELRDRAKAAIERFQKRVPSE